jgi:hypothetical protein
MGPDISAPFYASWVAFRAQLPAAAPGDRLALGRAS